MLTSGTYMAVHTCFACESQLLLAQAVELLNGTWNLAYTSNSELSQLLSLSRLPFLTVGPIQQIVDTGLMTAQNKVRSPGFFSAWCQPALHLLVHGDASKSCCGCVLRAQAVAGLRV